MKRIIWRAYLPSLFFLMLPVIAFYWDILFRGFLICGGDLINQFIPWRSFALAEIKSGRFPFWNPYVFCGAPFAANIQTSLFYPFNFLHILFSVERVFSLSLVFHHALALLAMYVFLNALFDSKAGAVIGALVYGWSGFLITHAHDGHLIHVRAYALIPLVLYFQTKLRNQFSWTSMGMMALCLAGMFFGGHTQIPLYIFYLLLFRALWWGGWQAKNEKISYPLIQHPLRTVSVIMFSLLLSALVLVPLIELSQQTAGRAGGADYSFATSDSLPPSHLITLFAPFFYGDPTTAVKEQRFWETTTGYHEICGYTGIFALILALLAFLPAMKNIQEEDAWRTRESWFFLILAGLGLFFALGKYNPLYPLLYYGLPGWSYFRVPGRLVLLFIIGIAVCSARGAQRWLDQDSRAYLNSRAFKTAVVVSACMGIGLVVLLVSKNSILSLLREIEVQRTMALMGSQSIQRWRIDLMLPQKLFEIRYGWMLYSYLLGIGILVAGWGALALSKVWTGKYRWLLIAGVILIDGLLFSSHFIETKSAAEWHKTFFPPTALTAFLKNHTNEGRVLCLDDAIGYPGLEKHPELRPNRLMEYGIHTVRGYDPIILKPYVEFVNRLYSLPADTAQGGLLFFPSLPDSPDFYKLAARWIVTMQTLSKPYSIAWKEGLSGMKVYENPSYVSPIHWAETKTNEGITIIKQTAVQANLHVITKKPAHLVFLQNYYPSWRCEINSKPVSIQSSDGFMSVACPAGESQICFTYFPVSFLIGGLLSIVSGLGFLVFVLWNFKKRTSDFSKN